MTTIQPATIDEVSEGLARASRESLALRELGHRSDGTLPAPAHPAPRVPARNTGRGAESDKRSTKNSHGGAGWSRTSDLGTHDIEHRSPRTRKPLDWNGLYRQATDEASHPGGNDDHAGALSGPSGSSATWTERGCPVCPMRDEADLERT